MTSMESDGFANSLVSLLTKINDHCCKLSNTQQPFGLCTITPKSPYISTPTKEIHAELENRAKEFFKTKQLAGIYFRYYLPPLMPISGENNPSKVATADDYQLTLQIPEFDLKWQQTVIARNLVYCSLEPGFYEYRDWFELQEEVIRLSPILDQTVKELEIIANIKCQLSLPVDQIFESFVYAYGLRDQNLPISREDSKKWKAKEIKWQNLTIQLKKEIVELEHKKIDNKNTEELSKMLGMIPQIESTDKILKYERSIQKSIYQNLFLLKKLQGIF